MKTILLTIIGVLCVTIAVLAYNLYQAGHEAPTPSNGSVMRTAIDTANALAPYEAAYEARTLKSYNAGKLAGNPLWGGIESDNVLSDITYYTQDRGKDAHALRSVWVDDTTILHFAYYLLRSKGNDTLLDGVRLVVEEYKDKVTLPCGTVCPAGTLNLALVSTRKATGGQHVNWYSDALFQPNRPYVTGNDAPPYDNYNDPCPASQSNCNN
jgi:hypothetical protein